MDQTIPKRHDSSLVFYHIDRDCIFFQFYVQTVLKTTLETFYTHEKLHVLN